MGCQFFHSFWQIFRFGFFPARIKRCLQLNAELVSKLLLECLTITGTVIEHFFNPRSYLRILCKQTNNMRKKCFSIMGGGIGYSNRVKRNALHRKPKNRCFMAPNVFVESFDNRAGTIISKFPGVLAIVLVLTAAIFSSFRL